MQEKFPFEIILDWYNKNGRHDLPWRHKQSPYHVWISEIFLQQTQVSRVVDYFNRVIERYPDIKDFSDTDYETFFPYYQGLGYYSRAKNMLKTAKIIEQEYSGKFPNTYKELISLPGVGPYTAQAILSFGYNQNILSWDTNLEKIFSRYYFGTRFVKLSKEQKEKIQDNFVLTNISGREMNAALMDFASLCDINEKNNISWEHYPLQESKFYKEKGASEHKVEKIINKVPKKDAHIIVILHEDHKEYYSCNPDIFEGFCLGKSNQDHRHFIKDHFLEKYNLNLSVRPVYKKLSLRDDHYFFYHAQIQTGNHDFGIFSKKEKKDWEDNFE